MAVYTGQMVYYTAELFRFMKNICGKQRYFQTRGVMGLLFVHMPSD
jgi:hypothetical protein